jgi:hypothetical protein
LRNSKEEIMQRKMRVMIEIMLLIAVVFLAYGTPVLATHDTSGSPPDPSGQGDPAAFDGHWDNWTVNDTGNQGLKGYLFIPAFLRLQCDPAAIHGPPAGFNKTDGAFGTTNLPGQQLQGGCTRMATDALEGWVKGEFFDPRGGTAFIPPSGDHHRSGYRTMLQVNTSGGAWMSGFAPFSQTFNNFNLTGIPGAGEAPDAILAYCKAGVAPFDEIPDAVNSTDFNGDGTIGTTGGTLDDICADWAALGGAAIMNFLDHHGEPMTPGRFPRYIPHERQGWPSTVVTKYTASSQNQGPGINQSFETRQRFIDGAQSTTPVTWYSMTTQNAINNGCNGGWCEWFWDPVDHTLCMVEHAQPGVKTLDTSCGGSSNEVTQYNSFSNLSGLASGTGEILVTQAFRKFEKAPVELYQKLGQWVEMDTDAATANYISGAGPDGIFGTTDDDPLSPVFTHNSGNGDLEQSGQAVWFEFWGLSGPNHQSEEGADPYTWRICGDRAAEFGDVDCSGEFGNGALDSPDGAVWAIVQPVGDNLGGLDPRQRYGDDFRPTTGSDCAGSDPDPALCGQHGVIVLCISAGSMDAPPDAQGNGTYTASDGVTYNANTCDSEPGTDAVYGTADDGTIYYREALENLQRGFVRENVGYSFSFLNGIGVNHPDLCGTLEATSYGVDLDGDGSIDETRNGFTTPCGDSPSTGVRQVVHQQMEELGATLSCFNCSSASHHTVPEHNIDSYSFKWTPLPGLHIPEEHPPDKGTIPE